MLTLEFESVGSKDHRRRYYRISVAPDLLRWISVSIEWGAIGSRRRSRDRHFASVRDALFFCTGAVARCAGRGYDACPSKTSMIRDTIEIKIFIDKYCNQQNNYIEYLEEVLRFKYRLTKRNEEGRLQERWRLGFGERVNRAAAEAGVVQLVPSTRSGYLDHDIYSQFCRNHRLHPVIRRLADQDVRFIGEVIVMTPAQFRLVSGATEKQFEAFRLILNDFGLDFNARQPQWRRPLASLAR